VTRHDNESNHKQEVNMSKGNRIIVAVIAVAVIVAIVIWLVVAGSTNKTAAPAASSSGTSASTITYDGSSFAVSNEKVASGSTVKVVNNSQKELDFDSDPHPTHTGNGELNEGAIAPGASKTFVLTKKGTWGFHNHLNSSQHGTITVE